MVLTAEGSKDKSREDVNAKEKVADGEKAVKEVSVDNRFKLLSSIVEKNGAVEEINDAKDNVSGLLLKWAVEKPWLVELHLLNLYKTASNGRMEKESIGSFSNEVKYMKKKIKATRSEISGAKMDRDEKSLALKNLKKFLKALEQLEAYLANLAKLSDKERENIDTVPKKKLSRRQRKVIEDRKVVGTRLKFLEKREKEDTELKAKVKKIALAN